MKSQTNGRKRTLFLAAFILYLGVLFFLVFMSQTFGRNSTQALRYSDMNFVPLRTISNYFKAWRLGNISPSVMMTNIFGNILAFVPFGFMAPLLDSRHKSYKMTLLWAFLLSLFIEIGQVFLAVGVFDVDDLILNVAGGLVGYQIYLLIRKHTKK